MQSGGLPRTTAAAFTQHPGCDHLGTFLWSFFLQQIRMGDTYEAQFQLGCLLAGCFDFKSLGFSSPGNIGFHSFTVGKEVQKSAQPRSSSLRHETPLKRHPAISAVDAGWQDISLNATYMRWCLRLLLTP